MSKKSILWIIVLCAVSIFFLLQCEMDTNCSLELFVPGTFRIIEETPGGYSKSSEGVPLGALVVATDSEVVISWTSEEGQTHEIIYDIYARGEYLDSQDIEEACAE